MSLRFFYFFFTYGFKGAVEILYHGQSNLEEKTKEYEGKFANPYSAASLGYIDDVIRPRETRRRVCAELRVLKHKVLIFLWFSAFLGLLWFLICSWFGS